MKTTKSIFVYTLCVLCLGCGLTEDVDAPKMALLSGGSPEGKAWRIANFYVTSTYCTTDKKNPQREDSFLTMSDFVKDNSFIIHPNGEVTVDDGEVRAKGNIHRFVTGQKWTLLDREKKVSISDPINWPSINGVFNIEVNKDQIRLTRTDKDNNKVDFQSFEIIFRTVLN